jgi:hypothetical protein
MFVAVAEVPSFNHAGNSVVYVVTSSIYGTGELQ